MEELNKPNKGDYYTIEYGLVKKTKHIVEILEDVELNCNNWRLHKYKCKYDDGNILLVHGNCFIEK